MVCLVVIQTHVESLYKIFYKTFNVLFFDPSRVVVVVREPMSL